MRMALVATFSYAAAMESLFALTYGTLFPWRSTPLGRQMFYYSATVAALMDLAILGMFWRPWDWVWIAGYAAFGVNLTWRLILLLEFRHTRSTGGSTDERPDSTSASPATQRAN